ncbi:hypothetical protein B0H13DRAFT_2127725 [Mycena leptocephala]|nr:hypothetical protein B0H13DRAFT_2127725 [Mycena leptocephala]
MCRLHAGTAPKDGKDVIFPVWDPKVYEATLSLFTKFVWAADQSALDDNSNNHGEEGATTTGATTTTNTNDPAPDLAPDVDDLPQALIRLPSTEPPENDGDRADSNALPATQATQPARILDPLLERQITAIEDPEERGRRRRELLRMNAYNLMRETNIARNKELLKKRGARGQEKDSGEDEANSEEEEEEESDSQPAPRAPRPVRAVTQKTSVAASATPSKTWNEDRAQLETTDLGDAFKGLVNSWWDYESGKGFVTQGKAIGGKKRPTQVKEWVSRARKASYTPYIADVAQFGRQWEAWWIEINPAWRQTDLPMGRYTDGAWDTLDVPGRNGFLNVLMCLKWWGDMLGPEEAGKSKEWMEAVTDVTWALDRLNGKPVHLTATTGDVATPGAAIIESHSNAAAPQRPRQNPLPPLPPKMGIPRNPLDAPHNKVPAPASTGAGNIPSAGAGVPGPVSDGGGLLAVPGGIAIDPMQAGDGADDVPMPPHDARPAPDTRAAAACNPAPGSALSPHNAGTAPPAADQRRLPGAVPEGGFSEEELKEMEDDAEADMDVDDEGGGAGAGERLDFDEDMLE